jgi:hypothetical protein
LSSRSLGKIGAEIEVLSWNHFYCQVTTALFHNQEIHLYACARLSSRSLGKIGAEIPVFLGTIVLTGATALFHNQETAALRMLQIEVSLFW